MIVARSRSRPPTQKSSIFVAPSQFAVDRQVEHCEVAPARVNLKPGPDIPDFLRFEGTLLTNESTFVPGRLSLVLFQDECLGHGLSLLSDSLPYSQLSAGLKHNARAALKLQTAEAAVQNEGWPPARRRHNRKFNIDRANLLLGGNPDLREIAIKYLVGSKIAVVTGGPVVGETTLLDASPYLVPGRFRHRPQT
jgi:hypothetical protein